MFAHVYFFMITLVFALVFTSVFAAVFFVHVNFSIFGFSNVSVL